MGTTAAVTTVKRSYRLLAGLFVIFGALFVWLGTFPDGGFVKGFFQGGAFAWFALAVFFFVTSFRSPRQEEISGMWRPSAGRSTDES
ncbi:MAG: hypothetical protein Q4G67_03345 [Actinomycetia bacterium]|nr:hypothetical protein [Actinomycetes bacterium]